MILANRPITSREYKLLLKPGQFQDLNQGIKKFWSRVQAVTRSEGGTVSEPDQDEILERKTWYLDTEKFDLRRLGFVLRMREELSRTVKGEPQILSKKNFKVTLKYRESDRYISAGRNMAFSEGVRKDEKIKTGDIDTKFEEDILPPFKSKFAHSTSVKLKQPPEIRRVADVVRFFPGIDGLDLIQENPIKTVNTLFAHEWAYRIGKLKFGDIVKVCLSFWYEAKQTSGEPIIAEFSFDYDLDNRGENVLSDALDETLSHFSKKAAKAFPRSVFEEHFPSGLFLEDYAPDIATGSKHLFMAMQEDEGVDLNGTTKTAFAYGER